MALTAVLDLGQRLERERARRFVGRSAELELFAARLQAAAAGETGWDLFSVLWVHGPGGIGKSTLLGPMPKLPGMRVSPWRTLTLDGSAPHQRGFRLPSASR
jgi:hypothetical protein